MSPRPTGGKGSNQYVTRAGGSSGAQPRSKTSAAALAQDQSAGTQIAGVASGPLRTKAQAVQAADRMVGIVEANPGDGDAWQAAVVWASTDLLDADPDVAFESMGRLMAARTPGHPTKMPQEIARFTPMLVERGAFNKPRQEGPEPYSSHLKTYPTI